MARSRVRKKAKLKKNATRAENVARNKRLKQYEGWYKQLDQIENQALANLVDRAAVEEIQGETDESQEDQEGR